MKKSIIIAGCAVFTMGLAGCGANNNAADNNRDQQVEINQVRRGPVTNEGNGLQLADRTERQIEQMPEVDDARVIISDNNAYVGVRLSDNNIDNDGNARVNDAMDGNGRTFAENGRVDQDDTSAGNDGIIDGQGDAGKDRRHAGNDGANISGNDMNGTARNNGEDFTLLEKQIEQRVRQTNKGIDRVYVSVDRNAYNRMGTFADDIRTDRNRDGLFEDFRNSMDDLFGR
ncbi:YhcN/YlaJ family sporulation lipoprotein [Bacillus sp. ISL-35]|uniref:YhcN/YlaJ family sporulation lipoprotein n=1 Tax=Bacillus sp. ISL-35 TaxID=2819122 RepID=UPI001BE9F4CE|nr:YhcN/YlaJ family sporulation lipoprotein [Bacillus sp. ISL-35]MBT2680434.1 YhcN/YlaJ family sporulation lipoprotein [Bacillus sp. ISL-35]MBT2704273.1 YhcN/YlaJ family sporulation lipoprotein [Chryseobacterium sp. ISL-80]